jgi:uncharacterized protein YbbC (DUF1343 family)
MIIVLNLIMRQVKHIIKGAGLSLMNFKKKDMRYWLLFSLIVSLLSFPCSESNGQGKNKKGDEKQALPAADNTGAYLPVLKGRRVALVINQTARVGDQLLLDTLIKRKVNVVKVFVPEHGFRGTADAGAHIKSDVDDKTGIPIISLYGSNKEPKKEQLKDVDVVVYDLQDVGVRFYTYISTLEYLMNACAANGKELIVLDRPNPNGHYVDGPVLDKSEKSFVGMQSIPVVYGMTPGEYARMLVGEKWLKDGRKLKMKVIPCTNYDHTKRYYLPVPPSPNLKSTEAVYLYPSLCFFEGTVVSVGRGTDKPFQQWGHPAYSERTDYYFVPTSTTGASKPMYEGKKCYGKLLATNADDAYKIIDGQLQLKWLLLAYQWYPEKGKFFNDFFSKLAGTKELRKQIEKGMGEGEIRTTWQKDLTAFKKIRKKYLLYKDFE